MINLALLILSTLVVSLAALFLIALLCQLASLAFWLIIAIPFLIIDALNACFARKPRKP